MYQSKTLREWISKECAGGGSVAQMIADENFGRVDAELPRMVAARQLEISGDVVRIVVIEQRQLF